IITRPGTATSTTLRLRLHSAAAHAGWRYNYRGEAMKFTKSSWLLVGATILVSFPVLSDMFVPSPSCYQPSKPYQFNSQWELDNFNQEVQDYKACISDFVEEQNEAARNHQQAASDAIDDWNRFVDYELN
ncbi:hypothetical protein PSH49_22445, partial [Pseudoalteromonas sp. GABNS16G]|uniref:hypothetical protein n=2 Tax=Gammaproteobacteria TaxID=1236 RepID=UPI0023595BA6